MDRGQQHNNYAGLVPTTDDFASVLGGLDEATLNAMLGNAQQQLAAFGAGPVGISGPTPFVGGISHSGQLSDVGALDANPNPLLGVVGGTVTKTRGGGKRRVRVTQACDNCSKKKIKCDGLKPACTRCFVNNLSCAYSRSAKKRGPAPGSIVSLHKRLKRLEYLLEKATGGKGEEFFDGMDLEGADDDDESEHSESESADGDYIKQEEEEYDVEPRRKATPAAVAQMPAKRGAKPSVANNPQRTGTETSVKTHPESPASQGSPGDAAEHFFSNFVSGGPTVVMDASGSPSTPHGDLAKPKSIDTTAGGLISVSKQVTGSSTLVGPLTPGSPSAIGLFDDLAPLPSKEVLDSLIQLYFKDVAPANAFIHRPTFIRNIRAQPPMLLYSMFAVAAPYSDRITGNRFEFANSMFERAKRLLYIALEQPPALVTIQTLLHLVLHGVTSWTQGAIAYQFTGIAIMMARQMMLNLDPDSEKFSKEAAKRNMRWVEKETRRRVWWALYNLDRMTAVAADRSCIISDNECMTALPCNPVLWEFDLPETAGNDVITSANMPAWVALFLSNPEEPLPDLTDADPYLYECMLNNVVGKIVEFHQWCAFREMNPFNPPNNPLGAAAQKKMEMVDEMMAKWYNLLPIQYKLVRRAAAGSGPAVLPWMTLFWRTAVVLLHCPRDTNMLRLEKDISWLSGGSFVRCSEESTHVAKLLEDMLTTSPNLDGAVPYAIFCILQTGLIHLVGIKNLQQQMIQACGSPECGGQDLVDLVNEAKRQLEVHIRALRVLARRFLTAERLATLMAKMLEDVEAPLVTGFGLLVSEESGEGTRLFQLLEIPEDMEAPVPAAACPVPHKHGQPGHVHPPATTGAARLAADTSLLDSLLIEPGSEFIDGGDFIVE